MSYNKPYLEEEKVEVVDIINSSLTDDDEGNDDFNN